MKEKNPNNRCEENTSKAEKKTGILTFSRSLNYGSTLQAWSLTQFLQQAGVNPEIIDYEPNGYRDIYALFRMPVQKRWIKVDLLHFLLLRFFFRRKKDFYRFWKKNYIRNDKLIRTHEDLQQQEQKYDILLCGSDQIWNTRARDFDRAFFFPDISNIRKIAYAVSVNTGNLGEKEEFRKWLSDFSFLSVREANSRDQLKKLLGEKTEVEICLDPTLLLQAEDFEKIMTRRIIEEPYIFFYSVSMKENAMRAAEILSVQKKLKIYTLISGRGTLSYLDHRKKIYLPRYNTGPEAFLSLIYHASYVVTDSFHGTAFSVVFHKPFCAVAAVDKNGRIKDDARIRNLLAMVGLPVVPEHQIMECIDRKICWEEVDSLRNLEARRSMNFLEKALS